MKKLRIEGILCFFDDENIKSLHSSASLWLEIEVLMLSFSCDSVAKFCHFLLLSKNATSAPFCELYRNLDGKLYMIWHHHPLGNEIRLTGAHQLLFC